MSRLKASRNSAKGKAAFCGWTALSLTPPRNSQEPPALSCSRPALRTTRPHLSQTASRDRLPAFLVTPLLSRPVPLLTFNFVQCTLQGSTFNM